MRFNFIAALILSIIVASFAIVNSKIVTINLLFTKVSVSQALVIFISVAVGAIIALLFGLVKEIKLKRKLKEKKKEAKNLKKEKENLALKLDNLEEDTQQQSDFNDLEEIKEEKENEFDYNG